MYKTLAINKVYGCGLTNTAHYKCLPKKSNVIRMILATDGPCDGSNKWSTSVIKMSGWIYSETFKRRL